MAHRIEIVIPIYNESESIPTLLAELDVEIRKLNSVFSVIFVDDCSTDNSIEVIGALKGSFSFTTKVISANRKIGQMGAIKQGLKATKGDFVVIMDGDGQDPPSLLPQLYEEISFYEGCAAAVQTKRKSRLPDSFFKRISAKYYYRVIRKILGDYIVPNVADYCILNRSAVRQLINTDDRNFMFRFKIAELRLTKKVLEFERKPRIAGESKYRFSEMLNLAILSITTFGARPLIFFLRVGIYFSLFLWCLILPIFILFYFTDLVPGWTSLVLLLLLSFSITCSLIIMIGIYVAELFNSQGTHNTEI